MTTRKPLAAFALAGLLALTACGNDDAPAPATSSSTSVASTTSKAPTTSAEETATSAATTTDTPPPAPEAEPSPQSQAEPYVVECLAGTPGPSLMSDGSVQNTEYCGNQPGAQDSRNAESNAGLDPSKIPYADGGTCPASICGYGHDANGNRNPSSGELQFQHGCEQGYISREQCAARGY